MTGSTDELSQPFVITRDFDAPRALVWRALTELEHLSQWMAPAGSQPGPGTLDLRVGGLYHYAIKLPDGQHMWGKWTFREIVPRERLVVVVNFSDAQRGVTRHPMSPVWPLSTLSTTTLTDAGSGTRMTLRWQALDATDAERATFDAAHSAMECRFGTN